MPLYFSQELLISKKMPKKSKYNPSGQPVMTSIKNLKGSLIKTIEVHKKRIKSLKRVVK